MAQQDRWLLPAGVDEVLPCRAFELERLRRRLLDLYWSWGYELVMPPLIEYLQSLLTGTGQDLDIQTFKLTDQLNGRMMGVRADITPQVARIDAHVLRQEGPRRYCYIGTTLHARPDMDGGSRCPLQVGAELFGHAGRASDWEVLALMLETLMAAEVEEIHLDLGHVGIYRALATASGLDESVAEEMFGILQRKAGHELESLLRDHSVPAGTAQMLAELPDLHGGPEVIGRARSALAGAPQAVTAALDGLEAQLALVGQYYPQVKVHVDLGELRGYAYHTGLIFAAFQPGVGRELARGGRYDDVGKVFGRARPATGFSADLNWLVPARQSRDAPPGGIWAPAQVDDALSGAVRELRRRGERVIQSLGGDDAHTLGCDRRLVNEAGSWVVRPLSDSSR